MCGIISAKEHKMMKCRWVYLVLALLMQALNVGLAARILAVCALPSVSHFAFINSLLKELAARGHEVTAISSMPLDKPLANYSNIDVELDLKKLTGGGQKIGEMNAFANTVRVLDIGQLTSEHVFENKKVQEIIKSKKSQFDVVIIEDFGNEALAGIAHVFKAHLVYLSSGIGFAWTNDLIGNPSNPAYMPNIFYSYSDHMTFPERFYNTIFGIVSELYYHLLFIPKQDALMRKHLQGIVDLPHLSEINARTSLVLTNAIVGFNYPQPSLPNLIQIGGIHIKPPSPLPQDLQTVLDSASEGVIYFSMGSLFKSAGFPVHIRESFLKVFAKLRQKVLWKFEVDHMPGKPRNVVIQKWFPQNDVLAHPKVKLFITHGGLLSSQEAMYHGVPLVGIPVFGDQKLNMRNAERNGYGLILEMRNITDLSVDWVLNEALNNPRYTERVKLISRIFHDKPQSPLESAVYWMEYIMRHKGAPHLRSAAVELSWYQYLLLDVILTILMIGGTVTLVLAFTCRKLFGSKIAKDVNIKKKRA